MAPVENPVSASWDLRISQADVDRLRAGFSPRDMDEKWLVTSETMLRTHIVGRPNRIAQAGPFPGIHVSPGLMVVRMSRSWTGSEIYTLGVRPITGGAGERVTSSSAASGQGGGGIIEAITWNAHPSPAITVSERQAKIEIVILCRSILGCHLEAEPDYKGDEMWDPQPDDDSSSREDRGEHDRFRLQRHPNGDVRAVPVAPANGDDNDGDRRIRIEGTNGTYRHVQRPSSRDGRALRSN